MVLVDVTGIMTANPLKINNTKTIPNIDMKEALEMAYIGAKKFHPRTFEPLLEKNTIIRIKNIWEKEKEGTIISQESNLSIKAVSVIDNLSILSVVGPGMVGRRGTAAEVFKVVSDADVNIITISQPASESTISFAIKNQYADTVRNKLLGEFEDRRIISDVIEMKNVASVIIVGNALKNDHDKVGLVMREATHHNILSASWSPTGLSITFILTSDDAWSLAKRLHDNIIRG
jgi:aspartate kinase